MALARTMKGLSVGPCHSIRTRGRVGSEEIMMDNKRIKKKGTGTEKEKKLGGRK